MGAVFAAEHVELNEPVAIKFLLTDLPNEKRVQAVSRFAREAHVASKIKSEYVARVSDVGRLSDGTPYIVMEYLEGRDLSELLQEHGALEVEQAVELVLQACEALAEAHALGILHRDLKPSNLFCVCRSDGLLAIKLLDFGISKITVPGATDDLRLTTTAATLGTPLYMAPEQMRSGRVADERSEIWSLGVILYELISGRPPFYADNLADLAVRIATEVPPPLRMLAPPALERVIRRCLEKDSAQRYQDVAALAQALTPFGPARAAAHAERAVRILQSARVGTTTRSQIPQLKAATMSHARLRMTSQSRWPSVLPSRVWLSIAVACVALAALGTWVWRSQPQAAQAPTVVRPKMPAGMPTPELELRTQSPVRALEPQLVVPRALPSTAPAEHSASSLAPQLLPSTPPVEHTAQPALEPQRVVPRTPPVEQGAQPARRVPGATAPTPPAATSGEPPNRTPSVRARPSETKPQPPAHRQPTPAAKSELEALGGRL
jgi:serine/threonine-protein kinase